MKILLVEDDENSRVLQEVALANLGHELMTAVDGAHALELLQSFRPDVIISDILMPHMDGYELCKTIKDDPRFRDIPFVFYTATYIDPKDEALAYKLGASRFLIKPMEPMMFIHQIEAVVREKEAARLLPREPSLKDKEEFNALHDERVSEKLDKKMRELAVTHEHLEEVESQLRMLNRSIGAALLEIGPNLEILHLSGAWRKLFRLSPRHSLPANLSEILTADGAGSLRQAMDWLQQSPREQRVVRVQLADPSGRSRSDGWLEFRLTVLNELLEEIFCVAAVAVDVDQQVQLEKELAVYRAIFERSSESIVLLDKDWHILRANEAFFKQFGYTRSDILNQSIDMLRRQEDRERMRQEIEQHLEKYGHWRGEMVNERADGSLFYEWANIFRLEGNGHNIVRYVEMISDITLLKNTQEELEYLAHRDGITGAFNRSHLIGLLRQAIRVAQRRGSKLAVIYIDLDEFKLLNDSFGHETGDRLLQRVARRLNECLRATDVVARYSADEFVILLEDLDAPETAAQLCEKIFSELAAPFPLDDLELSLTASAGIALFPDDGGSYSDLLKAADTAMFSAKKIPGFAYQFFSPDLGATVEKKHALKNELAKAIREGALELYYQAQVDTRTRELVGVEALCRWNNHGIMIPPIEFIALAEKSGLIVDLGDWVMEAACRQLVDWAKAGLRIPKVSINQSAQELMHTDVLSRLLVPMGRWMLKPSQIEVELTEGMLERDEGRVRVQLESLREAGFEVAIDDFGTGYSSLSRVHEYPISVLKIDRSFVSRLGQEKRSRIVVETIMTFAKGMGTRVIAEGVETEQQLAILSELGCDAVQGYLVHRPMPAAEFSAWLTQHQHNLEYPTE